MINNEIWNDVKGYEGLYKVSNLGRVMSLSRVVCNSYRKRTTKQRIMKLSLNGSGYQQVCLSKDEKSRTLRVHCIVSDNFIRIKNKGECINHKNGNKLDNRVDNLEIVSYSENLTHAYYTGLNKRLRKVGKYSLDGVFIRNFSSIAESARSMGKGRYGERSIATGCKDNSKSAYGFKWKYL